MYGMYGCSKQFKLYRHGSACARVNQQVREVSERNIRICKSASEHEYVYMLKLESKPWHPTDIPKMERLDFVGTLSYILWCKLVSHSHTHYIIDLNSSVYTNQIYWVLRCCQMCTFLAQARLHESIRHFPPLCADRGFDRLRAKGLIQRLRQLIDQCEGAIHLGERTAVRVDIPGCSKKLDV